MAESSRNEALQQAFIESDAVMRQSLASIIKDGIAAGEFRQDLDINATTILLFALIDGLIARKAINSHFSFSRDLPMFSSYIAALLHK